MSAFAVERNIVGSDSDGEVMWDGELSGGDCCCAASRDDAADGRSCFDFGDVEKKEVITFARDVDGRRESSFFSEIIGCAVGVVGAETVQEFRGLLGIAERKPSFFIVPK